MDKEFISIKDFAEKVGVSVQAIYKRINNKNDKIQPYLNQFNGKFFVSIKAVDELFKTDNLNQDLNQVENPCEIPGIELNDKNFSKVIDTLTAQIISYRKEIETKDKQIETKDKQIADLTELMKSNAQMLNQQQQLNLMDKQKILQLESAEDKKKRKFFDLFKNNKQ